MNETIEQAIRRLGAPREAWLSGGDTEDDHWRFGIAMSKCQDHSGSCASTGSCTFGGDCFHSALHKAREAAALIRSLSLRVEAEKRERERLKDRIDLRMNDYLVEMREGYDDSITGFNEAWDIVRSVFADMESNNAGK